MKRSISVWGVGWSIGLVLMGLGARSLWFGTAEGTTITNLTAAIGTSLAFMLSGIGVGLAANGLVAATSARGTSP